MSTPEQAVVESTMFRALAVLRVALLANALALGWYRRANMDHPVVGWAVLGFLAVWTLVALAAYSSPRMRRWPLLVGDLAVAVSTIAISPLIKGEAMRATLPGFWVSGVVFAWALAWKSRGGFVAALVVATADIGTRLALGFSQGADLAHAITQTNYANVFLLLIGGPVVGFLAALLVNTTRDRALAERAAAAQAERARLSRAVHDGVLQVLALVQRKGAELGGEFGELGRLAGEQEAALRALVQGDHGPVGDTSRSDLVAALAALSARQSPHVQCTSTGASIEMPAARVNEVVAVVNACLDNVAAHVGADANAWIYVEDSAQMVTISVRDEGNGIPDGRLEEAQRAGRLGVVHSIKGRIADLGGEARLTSGPGIGTEWEFDVAKEGSS